MNEEIVIERLVDTFDQNGILVDLSRPNEDLEMDSLQFVSVLVSLESDFNVSIPDDSFSSSELSNFSAFVKLVERLTMKVEL